MGFHPALILILYLYHKIKTPFPSSGAGFCYCPDEHLPWQGLFYTNRLLRVFQDILCWRGVLCPVHVWGPLRGRRGRTNWHDPERWIVVLCVYVYSEGPWENLFKWYLWNEILLEPASNVLGFHTALSCALIWPDLWPDISCNVHYELQLPVNDITITDDKACIQVNSLPLLIAITVV